MTSVKPKVTFSQYIVWLLVSFPAVAIVEAAVLQTIWRWFLAAQYGAGPALGAWFGISMVVHVMTVHLFHRGDDYKGDTSLGDLVERTIMRILQLCMVLGFSYGIGILFHWVS